MNTNRKVTQVNNSTVLPTTFGGAFKATMGYYVATFLAQTLGLAIFGGAIYLIIKALR